MSGQKLSARTLLRRTHRHLVSLGENDRDAGHVDASLVRLFRDWAKSGYWGGPALTDLADSIEKAKVPWSELRSSKRRAT